jgi:hypothetical protein
MAFVAPRLLPAHLRIVRVEDTTPPLTINPSQPMKRRC